MKVEPLPYEDRKVYSVAAFNSGVAQWLGRLPTVWVEGEVTELRRHERWASVFFTLKDPDGGSSVGVTMPRGRFDALQLELADGERVHVFGRPELFEQRGDLRLRALSIERYGLGAHLAALERLKAMLAAEGLFANERKRPLPLLPRRIGLVTGNDAAAKQDVITTIQSRFPAANILVAETYVQGPRAALGIVDALRALAEQPDVDVIVLTRGGGSFEDLLPFSDERLVRAVAASPVPVVSAVGHEQDTPLCDLAADVRASTPTMAGRLVVPELSIVSGGLDRAREALGTRRAAHARARRAAARPDGRAPPRRAAPRARAGAPARRGCARTPASRARACGRAEAGGARGNRRATRCVVTKGNTQARLRDRPDGLTRRRRGGGGRARNPRRCAARGGRLRRARGGRRMSEPEQTFEQAQAELEQIVERLEQGQASLDEALALWERGEQLYAFCRERLDTAQGKVEELARRVEQARPEPES